MPNWCSNELTIDGPLGDVTKILRLFAKDEPFNNILPRPEAEENNWHNWNIKHWSTKWDIDPIIVSEEELCVYVDVIHGQRAEITLHFDTAWSPPEGIIYALRTQFPDVSISLFYREDGMQLAGYL